ncbi:MAG TPA: hypothetical protein VGF16_12220 [Bryobacteraceae bacterium]|jgi:hypothetical protein
MLSQYFALLSVVFMIPVVFLFDRVHQRKRHYRWLWEMYEGIKVLSQAGSGA